MPLFVLLPSVYSLSHTTNLLQGVHECPDKCNVQFVNHLHPTFCRCLALEMWKHTQGWFQALTSFPGHFMHTDKKFRTSRCYLKVLPAAQPWHNLQISCVPRMFHESYLNKQTWIASVAFNMRLTYFIYLNMHYSVLQTAHLLTLAYHGGSLWWNCVNNCNDFCVVDIWVMQAVCICPIPFFLQEDSWVSLKRNACCLTQNQASQMTKTQLFWT